MHKQMEKDLEYLRHAFLNNTAKVYHHLRLIEDTLRFMSDSLAVFKALCEEFNNEANSNNPLDSVNPGSSATSPPVYNHRKET
jgi:hypothetical protein